MPNDSRENTAYIYQKSRRIFYKKVGDIFNTRKQDEEKRMNNKIYSFRQPNIIQQ